MRREDKGLAFLLRYENVAWYEEGKVRILDRRIYPTEIKFVECLDYREVVQAIKDMVTQSAGPYTAVGMGMALAAYQVETKVKEEQLAFLRQAADAFANVRVTTANRYKVITNDCLAVAEKALEAKGSAVQAIVERTIDSLNRRYATMEKAAKYLVARIPQNAHVLTQCFGETIIGMMCRYAKQCDKTISFYHAETRPFLQGMRLTASVCCEMGFSSTVITDNMVAYAMQHKHIDIFTSAADTIARDGHIANKIGTLQIAILAQHFGIPYFVTGIPDIDKAKGEDIVIEERDAKQILQYHDSVMALPGVKAIYPSFDITPPTLISGIITDKGIYSAFDLERYFSSEIQAFY